MTACDVCQGDGWIVCPTFSDATKKWIRIQKVRCPRGCPVDPNEPNVLPFPKVEVIQ
jgi:hypothetical protein